MVLLVIPQVYLRYAQTSAPVCHNLYPTAVVTVSYSVGAVQPTESSVKAQILGLSFTTALSALWARTLKRAPLGNSLIGV